jgi:polyphosphate kinase
MADTGEGEIAAASQSENKSENGSKDKKKDKKDKKDKDKDKKKDKKKAKSEKSNGDGRYGKSGKMKKEFAEEELERLQTELVKLQYWVKHKGLRLVVLFEGRDAAGKGGVIKRISEGLNPRGCRVVALGTPTERERTQWYFQRYVEHLPAAGEIVLFDRSWYNRAGVERVMGFCTMEQYREFLHSCPMFERMLVRSGIKLVKYWFSVSDEEQEARFRARAAEPTKRWKLSPMDVESRSRWVEYSKAKDIMFEYTDIKEAPWNVVSADDKNRARLNCIQHLLSEVAYEDVLPKDEIDFPPRQDTSDYVRPPKDVQNFVPERY